MATHNVQLMPGQRARLHVPRSAHAVGDQWRQLAWDAGEAGRLGDSPVVGFDPGAITAQPEPVRRWLVRALAPGVPLGCAIQLRMHGHIRVSGQWRPFEADQILAPPDGYIWAASARFAGLPVTGFDRYGGDPADGDGAGGEAADGGVAGGGSEVGAARTGGGPSAEMRWKLLGLVPVVTATGPDMAMSAAGRLALEIVLAPNSFGSADWEATGDPDVVRGSFPFAHGRESVVLRLAADGQVRSASMMRWGNPDDGVFARHPFGADLSHSETFACGLTIPTTLAVGWGWGTDGWETGEFFRAKITDVLLLG